MNNGVRQEFVQDHELCLTKACINALGLPEDSEEIQVMNSLKYGFLSCFAKGREDIDKYDEICPKLVEKINKREDALNIYKHFYQGTLQKCVDLIKNGKIVDAYELYKEKFMVMKSEYL